MYSYDFASAGNMIDCSVRAAVQPIKRGTIYGHPETTPTWKSAEVACTHTLHGRKELGPKPALLALPFAQPHGENKRRGKVGGERRLHDANK